MASSVTTYGRANLIFGTANLALNVANANFAAAIVLEASWKPDVELIDVEGNSGAKGAGVIIIDSGETVEATLLMQSDLANARPLVNTIFQFVSKITGSNTNYVIADWAPKQTRKGIAEVRISGRHYADLPNGLS